ncbi:hypothetical protein C1882_10500 [Pseudomonas sp. FW305-E2]|nr:hypothetical protein C1882_10500 [Pseudomonas sp. FW305-E2]
MYILVGKPKVIPQIAKPNKILSFVKFDFRFVFFKLSQGFVCPVESFCKSRLLPQASVLLKFKSLYLLRRDRLELEIIIRIIMDRPFQLQNALVVGESGRKVLITFAYKLSY